MAVLDLDTVVPYLENRRILEPGSHASAVELEGGVSGVVLSVRNASRDLVVKQALPRLRVDDEWLASTERLVTEGRALQLAGTLAPGAVPPVVDLDPDALVLTLERAPREWRNWKADLLDGRVDEGVAERLGTMLGALHVETTDPALTTPFADRSVFMQLRVEPFHRTVAERLPQVRDRVTEVVDTMLTVRHCLVHGDFTPKNILVGDGAAWVLDWEVAHVGDPTFDLASLLAHLVLKAVHRPRSREQYRSCAGRFVTTYDRVQAISELPGGESHLVAQVGCMLLARVLGKSPAGYLTDPERAQVHTVGVNALNQDPSSLEWLWQQLR